MTACSPLLLLLYNKEEEASPTPAPTPVETATPEATATPEPTPEATPAPLTEDALSAALDEATLFYLHWFYDRSYVIDPAYSDFMDYPPFDEDGTRLLYPTAADGISTYDDLLTATARYFEHETSVTLLEEIGAVDEDGRLCVYKSDGLGGIGMLATITADDLGNGIYALTMDYSNVAFPESASSVTVWYTPGAETEWFGGTANAIHLFFGTLLYAEELEYVLH